MRVTELKVEDKSDRSQRDGTEGEGKDLKN